MPAEFKRASLASSVHLLPVLALLLGIGALSPALAAFGNGPIAVVSVGPPRLIYNTARDGCSKLDVPDVSPRAFRDASGMIHLIGTASVDHEANRAFIGRDFAHLRHTCDVVFKGAINSNPAAYNDNQWLDAFYRVGDTIYGLAHNEWHGNENRMLCPSGSPDCNEESISEVYSRDDGYHFYSFPNGKGLVAAYPYQYRQSSHFFGIGGPTNIVRAGGFYYVLVAQIHPNNRALNGICVMRTNNIADPSSWRGWSGHDFSITFVNPYRANVQDPGRHLCAPLSNGALFNAGSLNWVPARQTFVLTVRRQAWDKKRPGLIGDEPGVYLYESKDFINWSAPVLLLSDKQAGGLEQRYPALIDPASKDPDFSTLGPAPLLFTVTSVKGAGYGSTEIVARAVKLGF
jgi:hypothetical protein